MNKVHERALRLVYGDSKNIFFSDALPKDKASLKTKNLQFFKLKTVWYLKQFQTSFFTEKPYNLCYM